MPLRLLMDVHVPYAITRALQLQGIDVVTAREVDKHELSDPDLMNFATTAGRVIFSYDNDMLKEAHVRMARGDVFGGVIYVHFQKMTVKESIRSLAVLSEISENKDLENTITFLKRQ